MEIVLLEPEDGARTEVLQGYPWSLDAAGGDEAAAPIAWDALTREEAIDRSVPRPVSFAWDACPGAAGYDLVLSRAPAFDHSARRITDLSAPHAEVWHLHLGTRYYWQVVAKDIHGWVLATSPTRTLTTHHAPPRWIAVPGITNVRDLGGWPLRDGGRIRQGKIYRSSEMNEHVTIAPEGRRVLEEHLRIRTDLDLRAKDVARPALDTSRVRWVNVPVLPYAEIGEAHTRGQAAYRKIFALLADAASYPLIFHCWGGADRGGTLAFLLGALLGMERDHLIADYELTSLSIWGPRTRASAEFTGLLAALQPYADDPHAITPQVESYLSAIGVTPPEVASIRALLVEQGHASG